MSPMAAQRAIRWNSDAVEIRAACKTDNDALLSLTRRTPMSGDIALRIDRDPDFFALARHRGSTEVLIAVRGSQVLASLSVTVAEVYVNGVVRRGAYIADVKAAPEASSTRVLPRLLQAGEEYARMHSAEFAWCVVAAGNQRVTALLEGRLGIARFVPAGRFIVDELLNINTTRRAPRAYVIDEASPSDSGSLDTLHDSFHRTRELAPAGSEASGDGTIARLVARRGSKVVAAMDLFDPSLLKRNVLLGAPRLTRVALGILGPFAGMLGCPPLPRIGEPVRLAYVRRFACEPEHIAAFAALVRRARTLAAERGFPFTAIGLHERDPLRRALLGMLRVPFTSCLYVAPFRSEAPVGAIVSGIPIQDYSYV
jgi:hypothetical protein